MYLRQKKSIKLLGTIGDKHLDQIKTPSALRINTHDLVNGWMFLKFKILLRIPNENSLINVDQWNKPIQIL